MTAERDTGSQINQLTPLSLEAKERAEVAVCNASIEHGNPESNRIENSLPIVLECRCGWQERASTHGDIGVSKSRGCWLPALGLVLGAES